jgi:UDP-4-amino-4,6-dideoxy-N-acetyl-beta-L-altrosamine N-acetyltransferase
MIVEQYGLRYIRVTEQDIELIRYWRNKDFIRNTMQFREYITPEMQKKWFQKINNKYNYYFIIEADNQKIGLLNYKDPAPNTKTAEGGIFIWEQDYWGTPIPVLASLTMLECMYEVLNLRDNSMVTIAKNNKRALSFNKMLGYEIYEPYKNEHFFKLILTKEHYLKKTTALKKAAALYTKGNTQIKITAEESPLLSDDLNNYMRANASKRQ